MSNHAVHPQGSRKSKGWICAWRMSLACVLGEHTDQQVSNKETPSGQKNTASLSFFC